MVKLSFSPYLLFTLLTVQSLFAAEIGSGDKKKTVLILGDSLTEGYGVGREKAFPFLLQELLKKKGHSDVVVQPAGISGSTTASGLSRLRWFLKKPPQILVLALGGNDLLRALKPADTKKNLKGIIELAKKNHIKVLLSGMMVPPNYGADYKREFEKIFTDLAKEEKVELIPFLLEGVGGVAALNLEDGVHPNEKGHAIVADVVAKYLEPML